MCNAMQRFVNHYQEEARLKGHREGLREGHREGLREGHREGLREGLREGRLEGLINSIALCKEFDCSQEVTIEKILSKFSLSEEEAENYVKQYW